MKNYSPLLFTDSYKVSHAGFSPDGLAGIYSNFTPRYSHYFKDKYPAFNDKYVQFGVQYAFKRINDMFSCFFAGNLKEEMDKISSVLNPYIGEQDMGRFESLHKLGYLPIEVRSIEEGSLVNMGVPSFTVRNTHPDFAWLTNYLETLISAEVWKPLTIATIAKEFRNLSLEFSEKTCDNDLHVKFQNHDFSYRGQSGSESDMINSVAWLTQSIGTDNIPGIMCAKEYYQADDCNVIALSVPASEHSVATLGILSVDNEDLENGEATFLARVLEEYYPKGIVSYVADSYDFWSVITEILPSLKEEIMNREGKLVIRPDCYSDDTSILTPNGWKLFKDLTDNDLVAQVLDDGTYEFTKPLKKQVYDYNGNMYHFTDSKGKLDILVTPDHRMIYQQIDRQTKEIKEVIKFAKDFSKNNQHNYYFERSAKAKNQNKSLTLDERLNIAFQADGSYCTDSKTNIRFNFSKERKIERLKSILDLTGYKYKIYNLADGRVEININVQDSSKFYKHFNWVNKENLCSNWCEEFLEELKHWDSSVRNEGRFKYDTTIKSCIEIVELIALSAGKGVLIMHTEDNRSEKYSDIYTANILDYNTIGGQSWKINEVLYKGKVYCVQVPTGRLLVKRNRCTLVCGNSGDPVLITAGYNIYHHQDGDSIQDSIEKIEHFPFSSPTPEVFCMNGRYYDIRSGFNISSKNQIQKYEAIGTVAMLWEIFGGYINDKHFKVLDDHIGMIYGDGITYARAKEIFERLSYKGFASSNVVFGIGSYTLNMISRDDLGCAIKATHATYNGEEISLYKNPKTDSAKKSAKGYLFVHETDNGLELESDVSFEKQDSDDNMLKLLFRDGVFSNCVSLDSIRSKLNFKVEF